MIEMMETMSETPFNVRLRDEIRARFGKDHEGWFADQIGMSRTRLSRILNSKPSYRPEDETVLRFAAGLGLDPAEVARWIPSYIAPDAPAREPAPLHVVDVDGLAEALAAIDAMTDEEVVSYAEALPGDYHHRFMAEEKRLRSHESYVRFCRGMLGAFASNRNAALKAARSARE